MAVDVQTLESTYKALADATRLRILALLVDGEVCVCDLHDTLRVPQAKASRHLAYLRRAGLVETRREGTWMHYRMAGVDPVVEGIIRAAAHAMTHVPLAEKDRTRFERDSGKRLRVISAPHAPCCAR